MSEIWILIILAVVVIAGATYWVTEVANIKHQETTRKTSAHQSSSV